MAGYSQTLETELLEHILNNADVSGIGDATGLLGSTVDGNLYISLHTADPVESDDQTVNECAYTSYARVAAVRDGTYWTVTASTPSYASPVANIVFPTATGGSETATHWGVGTDASGVGKLIASGTITPTISISSGVSPTLETGSQFRLS